MLVGLYNKLLQYNDFQIKLNKRRIYLYIFLVLKFQEGSGEMKIMGHNSSLIIDPVAYKHQGTYICLAENFIKGNERRLQSEAIQVEVVGEFKTCQLNTD